MRAIMKKIKSNTCANIMNLIQSILVIKDKREASAIQKLIDEYGYAEIYGYCSKSNKYHWYLQERYDHSTDETLGHSTPYYTYVKVSKIMTPRLDGKVLFKFRCYKVEEIGMWNYSEYGTPTLMENSLCIYSCLNFLELRDYIKDKPAYAIHISNLEIFDEPKELGEFKIPCDFKCPELGCCYCHKNTKLTKAPQNFCYVEVE